VLKLVNADMKGHGELKMAGIISYGPCIPF
jgi:hypothetical protein